MSPGTRGKRVSRTRMPTENPPRFVPPRYLMSPTGARSVEARELVTDPAKLALDLLVIRRFGEVREISLPVRKPARDLPLLAPRDPAVPPLAPRLGVHDE